MINYKKARTFMIAKNNNIYGIIHIGSASLSMRIVAYYDIEDIEVIEEVEKDITFGEEVFLNKKLSFASVRKLCHMLNGLKQLLNDYQVTEYRVYATAVFREAENRRSILDLVQVNTGFIVNVLDMSQEIYLEHFAVQHKLKREISKEKYEFGKQLLYIDITSGCLGFTVWQGNAIKYQQNLHIGSLRLLEIFNTNQRASKDYPQALAEYIHVIMSPIWNAIKQFKITAIVFSGRESRMIAQLLGYTFRKKDLVVSSSADVFQLYNDLKHLSVSHILKIYNVEESVAEIILPTIYIWAEILKNMSSQYILIMKTTFLEAVSMYYGATKTKDDAIEWMHQQNLTLTEAIARRYYYEPEHTKCMQEYSQIIIHAFKHLNGLGKREEFLLAMTLILYQIGKHVNLMESNKNTWSLIRSIDIFGISEMEKDAVACIAFYAQKGMPEEDDYEFKYLDSQLKMTVLKLIAIFRLTYAMDISRKQKIKDVTARMQGDFLLIEYNSMEKTSLEEWMFAKENDLFKNIFGIEAKLEKR